MDSRSIIRALEAEGWREVRVTGSHHHFRHQDLPGTVTVPHPKRDLPIGTVRSIERQSGVKLLKGGR
jgi:predicted RNA binding protein YcfA (HicA-like mRNA interferase family)